MELQVGDIGRGRAVNEDSIHSISTAGPQDQRNGDTKKAGRINDRDRGFGHQNNGGPDGDRRGLHRREL